MMHGHRNVKLSAHIWRHMEVEKGSTRWHLVENSLWKRLQTCRKRDCRKTMLMSRYLGFLHGSFSQVFSVQNTVCISLVTPHVPRVLLMSSHLISISLVMYSKECKSWSCKLRTFLHFRFTKQYIR